MKKYLLILTIFVALSSCKKDKSKPVSDLNGTWELHSMGGLNAKVSNYVTDRYIITNENQYIQTVQGKVVSSGSFIVDLSKQGNGYRHGTIIFNSSSKIEEFYLKADTFVIGNPASDAPSLKYARIKK